jgi:hypothetical protein
LTKLITTLIAVAALAVPTAALAHDGGKHGKLFRHHHSHGLFAKLSGTGSSFSGANATATGSVSKGSLLSSGTFSASLNTNWGSATSKTFSKGTLACAPSSATLTIAASTGNAVTSNLTGKACSFTKSDGSVVRAFFGKGSSDGAGTLAGLDGTRAKLWLVQKADGTVKGAAWAARMHRENVLFVKSEREAKHTSGCDHDH